MKPAYIFDLNGTLIKRMPDRTIRVRPGVLAAVQRAIDEDYEVYTITSMQWKNAKWCLRAISPEWRSLMPKCIVNHEIPAPTDEEPWRTVRDIGKVLATLKRSAKECTFVDNDAYKYEGTDVNLIIVPSYDGEEDGQSLDTLLW